uniref:Ubiquitin-like-conjugating enzyme ATG10 n=1 Tax=Entomoneis paludosa TaxID=265537 RepID=A0A7S2YGH4_9STRA
MSWSLSEFASEAKTVSEAFQHIGDSGSDSLADWALVEDQTHVAFLKRAPLLRRSKKDKIATASADELCLVDDTIIADNDLACIGPNDENDELLVWIFSIVYSDVWECPVLYFRVEAQDGALVTSREHIVQILKLEHYQNEVEDSWEFVSYDEHPVDGLPSFFLHPCQTRERVKTLLNSTDGKRHDAGTSQHNGFLLLTWMSMIFPAVGMTISSQNFVAIQKQLSKPKSH